MFAYVSMHILLLHIYVYYMCACTMDMSVYNLSDIISVELHVYYIRVCVCIHTHIPIIPMVL